MNCFSNKETEQVKTESVIYVSKSSVKKNCCVLGFLKKKFS